MRAYQKRPGYARFIFMNSQINSLLSRGVEQVLPSPEFLQSQLSKPGKLKIYAGIDPTGPTLHIGHAIVLRKLREFQKLGHEIILLIGDFTAQIGDPTDKTATRKVLTESEIENNLKLYKKQASKFLDFSMFGGAKIVYNSTWLKKLDLKKILEIMSLMTVDQMLKRDMFVKRMEENKPISLHEFMYPLLQGYDSVMLDVDVEIGGNDQMFNMLVGRDLEKKLLNKEKTAITMKLLADATGKKMGKTEGNMVSLSDSSTDMFGKIMSWTDGMIIPGFELCTDVTDSEINKIKEIVSSGVDNPRDIKIRLAKEIVSFYHNKEAADAAERNFINTFSKGDIPEEIPEFKVVVGSQLSKELLDNKIIESISEFKRLVKEGAVTIIDGDKISDFNFLINSTVVVKVGKRRFVKFIV